MLPLLHSLSGTVVALVVGCEDSNLVVECHAVMNAFAISCSISCLASTPAPVCCIDDAKVVIVAVYF
jgi:hypothetical protein